MKDIVKTNEFMLKNIVINDKQSPEWSTYIIPGVYSRNGSISNKSVGFKLQYSITLHKQN